MLTQKSVPCSLMVEFLRRRVPLDDVEILAVVLGVTTDAIRRRGAGRHHSSVQSAPCLHSTADLGMTIKAFKPRFAESDRVAGRTLSGSIECAMGCG
jgi:hypothetical protein